MMITAEELIPDSLTINASNINVIVFPDWLQSEDALCVDLERVIWGVNHHSYSKEIRLFIYSDHTFEEIANLILSGVVMNLLMVDDSDISSGCEISLLENLDADEWELLKSQIHARIILPQENQEALVYLQADNLPAYTIDEFSEIELSGLILDLANRLFQKQQWQAAIAKYEKLLELEVYTLEIYQNLIHCYRSLNLLDEYFTTLQRGIELYPTEGSLHFSLIIDLRRNGRIKEAIASAENACNLIPEDYTFKLLKYWLSQSRYVKLTTEIPI
ncbi:MAG: hypothetical protein VKL60_14015 [Sphaerospermopsis sp.]|nr:hypothetical protein [Sphaerospermopsis sp.]